MSLELQTEGGGRRRLKGEGVPRLFELVWVVFLEEKIPQPQPG